MPYSPQKKAHVPYIPGEREEGFYPTNVHNSTPQVPLLAPAVVDRSARAHTLVLPQKEETPIKDMGARNGRDHLRARDRLGVEHRVYYRIRNKKFPFLQFPARRLYTVLPIEYTTEQEVQRQDVWKFYRWVCDFHDEQPVANQTLEAHEKLRVQFYQSKQKTLQQMRQTTQSTKHPNPSPKTAGSAAQAASNSRKSRRNGANTYKSPSGYRNAT